MWKRWSSFFSCSMTCASRSGPSPGLNRSQIRFWQMGWTTGQILLLNAQGEQVLQVFGDVHGGVSEPRALAHHLHDTCGGNSFIITPPFSPSAICVTSGGTCLPGQLPAREPLGLVIGLHLRHQLGVAALGLDDGDDAGLFAPGVPARPAGAAGACVPGPWPFSGRSTVCSCTSTHW